MSSYRVNHKIHIGGASTYLEKGEVITYSGKNVIRGNGEKLELPSSFLAGAIKQGWLVTADSEETEFRPQPAGIEVREAVSSGNTRELVSKEGLRATAEETSVAKTLPMERTANNRREDDGRVVARLKPLSSAKVEIGKDDRRVVQELDNKSQVDLEPVKVATGDVEVATSGDELTELLPDAAASEKPPGGVYKEKATTNSGSSSVGGAEEGVVIARVSGQAAPVVAPAAAPQVDAQRDLLLKWAAGEADVAVAVAKALALEVLGRSAPALEASQPAAAAEPASPVEFSWDMTRHWKTRQKDVLKNYMDNPDVLRTIASIEYSKGVLKVVEARLAELGA